MKTYLLIILGSLLLISCEDALIPEDATDSPAGNFNTLWTYVDRYYPYFAEKGVDWDSVRRVYEPQIRPDMTDEELFGVLGAMLNTLKDGHTNLFAPFETSFYDNALLYPVNFSLETVAFHYLGAAPEDSTITTDYPGFFVNLLPDDILYVYYASFGNSADQIALIIKAYPEARGMILDIRSNGGGDGDFALDLAGHFTPQRELVAFYTQKIGPAHDDISTPLPVYVDPRAPLFNKRVMVLTNRGVYSAGSNFVEYVKHFENVTIVGDTTGGGAGSPIDSELPNGWTFRISQSPFLGKDGFDFEEGTPPDIVAMDDPNTLETDEIIERALEEF